MMRDGRAYALLDFDVPAHRMNAPIEQLRSLNTADDQGMIRLTGKPVVQQDVNQLSFRDRAEIVAYPLPWLFYVLLFEVYVQPLLRYLWGSSVWSQPWV